VVVVWGNEMATRTDPSRGRGRDPDGRNRRNATFLRAWLQPSAVGARVTPPQQRCSPPRTFFFLLPSSVLCLLALLWVAKEKWKLHAHGGNVLWLEN
jgi:hypothetical protein